MIFLEPIISFSYYIDVRAFKDKTVLFLAQFWPAITIYLYTIEYEKYLKQKIGWPKKYIKLENILFFFKNIYWSNIIDLTTSNFLVLLTGRYNTWHDIFYRFLWYT